MTDSSNKVFTLAADISIRILGIVFNSDSSILMTEDLYIFLFFPVGGRFFSGKENKCCKQLFELTAAWGENQAGKKYLKNFTVIRKHRDRF